MPFKRKTSDWECPSVGRDLLGNFLFSTFRRYVFREFIIMLVEKIKDNFWNVDIYYFDNIMD